MLRGKITIQNAASLIKKLSTLSDIVQKQVLGNALRKAAVPVKNATHQLAPRDTGLLAGTIKIDNVKRGRTNAHGERSLTIAISAGGKTKGGTASLFKGNTYYLGFVEFGTKFRFHKKSARHVQFGKRSVAIPKSGKYVGRVIATSFMQRAFEATKDEAASIMAHEIGAGIARAVRG